jgi:pilus assembly protein Flp/PilA
MMRDCVSFLLGSFGGRGAQNAIIRRLMEDESGVTAIEYGLIAALIAIAAIVAMTSLGGSLSNVFSLVATDL